MVTGSVVYSYFVMDILHRGHLIVGEMAALQSKTQTPLQTLTPQKIEAVARVLNRRFSASTPFSRAYLKATVNEIRVSGDFLRLSGENKTMANLVAANGKIDPNGQVLGFIPDWRAVPDKSEYWNMELSIPAAPQFASRKKAREPALG